MNSEASAGGFDRSSQVPLYVQIAEQLRKAIDSRDIVPGGQLGNETALAGQFGVSRSTMRQAIRTLMLNGLLAGKKGLGTTVLTGPAITRPVRLTSLFDDPGGEGGRPETVVLVHQVIPASQAVRDQLDVASSQPVLHLRRARALHGRVVAILENYIPAELFDSTNIDFGDVGLHQALRAIGVHPKVARQRIGAREGTAEECELLDTPLHSPVLTMDQLSSSDTGRVLEWGRHVFHPDSYAFTLTVTSI